VAQAKTQRQRERHKAPNQQRSLTFELCEWNISQFSGLAVSPQATQPTATTTDATATP
jgi:hypothetical protein